MHQLLQDSRNDARELEKQMRSSYRNVKLLIFSDFDRHIQITLLKQFFKEIKSSHVTISTLHL